ncbi:uncharacterized protein [Miscanthus floridulus]|uniref:uncharacterized protein n=1 Tax=Miscanthus floridulus TaxID=154761 RepID=UPI0034587535
MAQMQLTPLVARVKELEEELTRAVRDQDAFRGQVVEAMASAVDLTGQLGAEQRAHQLTKELGSEASRAAEASRVEAQHLKEEAEASRAEALRWKEKTEACQAETRRWEQRAKGEFRGFRLLT